MKPPRDFALASFPIKSLAAALGLFAASLAFGDPKVTPTVTPPPRDCCQEARDQGVGAGAGGTIICCDGQAYACVIWTPAPNVPGDRILESCLQAHEGDHLDDVAPCPPGSGPTQAVFAGGVDRIEAECHAYQVEVQCLTDHMSDCDALPTEQERQACRQRVQGRIDQIRNDAAPSGLSGCPTPTPAPTATPDPKKDP